MVSVKRTRVQVSKPMLATARALLIVVGSCAVGEPVAADTVDRLLEVGQKQLAKGNYQRALKTFREADAAANGSSVEVVEAAATAAALADRWELVQDYGERTLSLADSESRKARAHHFLGLAALRGSPPRPEDARRHLESALLGGGQRDWQTIQALAECLELLGELEDAATLLGELSRYEEARTAALRIGHRISRRMGALPYFEACLRGVEDEESSHPRVRLAWESGKVPVFGNGLTAPERVQFKPPPFLENARRKGLSGEVVALTVITRSGRVVCPVAIREVEEELAFLALPEITTWEFLPAREGGEAIPVPYILTLGLNLGR